LALARRRRVLHELAHIGFAEGVVAAQAYSTRVVGSTARELSEAK
jgi:hypothetical protein